jgi:TolA-binding protein
VDEAVEEIRFYVGHGMPEQAMAALAKLQTLTRDQAKIDELRAEVDAAMQPAEEVAVAEPAFEEITAEDVPSVEVADETPVAVEEEPAPVEPEPAAIEEIPVVAEVQAEPEPQPAPVVPEPVPVAHEPEPAAQPAVLKEFVSDLESSLGDGFLPGTVSKPSAPELAPVAHTAPTVEAGQPAPVLGEFVADIEASLGEDFLKAAPVPESQRAAAPKAKPVPPPRPVPPVAAVKPSPLAASAAASAAPSTPAAVAQHAVPTPAFSAPVAPAASASAISVGVPKTQPVVPVLPPTASASAAKSSPFGEDAGIDLAEMFGELKQDLEADVASTDEDPETHYNLGIAFREMGLLDEAIGELQKACQAFDHGRPFQQIMQAYTWLAQCFLEKGVPEAAVRWYDKALQVPTIDGETRVALNYELAAAYETAGDKASALKHFMDVYGSNIDYRDVAERIKALKS